MRSLTEDVEGAHCSVVGETNAAIAISLDVLVAEKRKEEARRECNFKTQRDGCVLGWGGEGRGDKDWIEEVPYNVPHFGIMFYSTFYSCLPQGEKPSYTPPFLT